METIDGLRMLTGTHIPKWLLEQLYPIKTSQNPPAVHTAGAEKRDVLSSIYWAPLTFQAPAEPLRGYQLVESSHSL